MLLPSDVKNMSQKVDQLEEMVDVVPQSFYVPIARLIHSLISAIPNVLSAKMEKKVESKTNMVKIVKTFISMSLSAPSSMKN